MLWQLVERVSGGESLVTQLAESASSLSLSESVSLGIASTIACHLASAVDTCLDTCFEGVQGVPVERHKDKLDVLDLLFALTKEKN